jgi:hypothetical protein
MTHTPWGRLQRALLGAATFAAGEDKIDYAQLAPSGAKADHQSMKLLLLEDDSGTREDLERVLSSAGHVVDA